MHPSIHIYTPDTLFHACACKSEKRPFHLLIFIHSFFTLLYSRLSLSIKRIICIPFFSFSWCMCVNSFNPIVCANSFFPSTFSQIYAISLEWWGGGNFVINKPLYIDSLAWRAIVCVREETWNIIDGKRVSLGWQRQQKQPTTFHASNKLKFSFN